MLLFRGCSIHLSQYTARVCNATLPAWELGLCIAASVRSAEHAVRDGQRCQDHEMINMMPAMDSGHIHAFDHSTTDPHREVTSIGRKLQKRLRRLIPAFQWLTSGPFHSCRPNMLQQIKSKSSPILPISLNATVKPMQSRVSGKLDQYYATPAHRTTETCLVISVLSRWFEINAWGCCILPQNVNTCPFKLGLT